MTGRILRITISSLLFAAAGPLGFAIGAGAPQIVSQKGRAFVPQSVQVAVGDTLTIKNDDEFVHDVMINSNDFKFDSGEQAVGQNVHIKFPRPGIYRVICAIHPKMRLDVEVK